MKVQEVQEELLHYSWHSGSGINGGGGISIGVYKNIEVLCQVFKTLYIFSKSLDRFSLYFV